MCRLFGLHAAEKSDVFQALISHENALMLQSKEHRDGWGIAYYAQGMPHLVRSMKSAQEDDAFRRISQTVQAQTVVAHLRRATEGAISLVNCHPFQFGRWVMAHNGNLPQFRDMRADLLKDINPSFLAHIFGTTDSEVYFCRILHELDLAGLLNEPAPALQKCAFAFRRCVEKIETLYQKARVEGDLSLNVILSNGNSILGFRYNRELHFNCHGPAHADGEKAPRLTLSSEPLNGDNTWQSFKHGQIVGADHEVRVFRSF